MDPWLWAALFVVAVSFLSNVSPFVGASYTLLSTLELTLLGPSPGAFLLVVVASAVGATVAKLGIYYGAFGLRKYLVRNKNVRLVGRYSSTRGFYVALFVAAVLPVFPFDDYFFIGGGATSASLGAMAAVTLWAKVLKSLAEIALEFTVLSDLASAIGGYQLILTAVLTVAFVVIGVVAYRVDWEEVLARWRKPGEDGAATKAL
ncbi:MAG: hypothetical protein JRN06_01265 [Nitrososphaerota archaeon]|nr:hypothetical protein [Nitrososphaerota archaeon]MDG7023519.1 hypothetical protein [Nitrososphaerota archaeon]